MTDPKFEGFNLEDFIDAFQKGRNLYGIATSLVKEIVRLREENARLQQELESANYFYKGGNDGN